MRTYPAVVLIVFTAACSTVEREFTGSSSSSAGSTGGGGAGGEGAGDGGAGGSIGSQGGGGAGTCAGAEVQIPNVVASSPGLGTCCSGGFKALTDGSGLTGLDATASHGCNDTDMWSSNAGNLAGVLSFDLGQVYELHQVVVWNSAQVNGERGVRDLTMTVSEDGSSYSPLNGGPTVLQIRTDCPSASESFAVEPAQVGRYIRFTIENSHTQGGATSLGLGEVWFMGASCP